MLIWACAPWAYSTIGTHLLKGQKWRLPLYSSSTYSPLMLLPFTLLHLLHDLCPSVIAFRSQSLESHPFKLPQFHAFSLVYLFAAAAAKSLQSCPTLCDPREGSPPSSPIPGILQARTLEWVAISFSNAWKWKVKVKLLSCVWLQATPWNAAYQAPPSMGFARQEYWSGLPLPSPLLIWLKHNPDKNLSPCHAIVKCSWSKTHRQTS